MVIDLESRGRTSDREPEETPGRTDEPRRRQTDGQRDGRLPSSHAVPDWDTSGGPESRRDDHPSVALLQDVDIVLANLAPPDFFLQQRLRGRQVQWSSGYHRGAHRRGMCPGSAWNSVW